MAFLIFLLCLAVAVYFKAMMDISGKDGFPSGDKRNRSVSSGNKYADGYKPYVPKWYYGAIRCKILNINYTGFIVPLYKERFIYSTTLFVWLTDYWHRCQFFWLNFLFIGCATLSIYSLQGLSMWFNWSFYWWEALVHSFILIRIVYAVIFNKYYK